MKQIQFPRGKWRETEKGKINIITVADMNVVLQVVPEKSKGAYSDQLILSCDIYFFTI